MSFIKLTTSLLVKSIQTQNQCKKNKFHQNNVNITKLFFSSSNPKSTYSQMGWSNNA